MKEKKIIYQIKSLDKIIFRNVCNDKDNKELISKIVTPTQLQIIEYILEHIEEDIYQKDLENILNLRRATVSGVLQTMEKNNLIERVTAQLDTRTKKIILTKKAKEEFCKRSKKIDDLEEKIIKDISKEELDIFLKVIKKIKNNLESSK